MIQEDDLCIKVIVIGDGNVGKTTMLRRFVRGEFMEQYKTTIGAEFMEKDVFVRASNSTIKLMLWDTAGQEVFNSLTQAYYRGAGAAIICFSTVDRESFMNVGKWKDKVNSVCGQIPMILCQTKFDLSQSAAVTHSEAEQLAINFRIPFFRVSTKDNFNVSQLFEFTGQQCFEVIAAEQRNTFNSTHMSANSGHHEGITSHSLRDKFSPDLPVAPTLLEEGTKSTTAIITQKGVNLKTVEKKKKRWLKCALL